MNTKNILIFTDWYYPAFKAGGPITSIYNLVKLLKNDYEFHIVTGSRDLGSTEILDGVVVDRWCKGNFGENILYVSNDKLSRSTFNSIIEITSPNILFLNSLFSVNFVIKPLIYSRKMSFSVFLSPRGMLHPQAFSQKRLKKAIFIRLLQCSPSFKRVCILATDEVEKTHIRKASFKNNIQIVPNIPDLELLEAPSKTVLNPVLAIVSRIAEEKNSIFALEVLHNVKGKVTVHWVGDCNNPAYFEVFKGQIADMPSHVSFQLHGGRSKKHIQELLDSASFFFLPTLGENFGHAIFEALASGCPSIIGENTPFREIEKYNCGFLADLKSSKNTALQIDQLMASTHNNFIDLSKNAKRFAKEMFNSAEAKNAYKSIW